MKRLAVALLGVLLAATPALAGTPEQDKQFVAFCAGCLTVIPLALVPLGLAFHLLLRAMAPRGARRLVLQAEGGRAKTFALGAGNGVALMLIAGAATHLHLGPLALLAVLAFWTLVFFGSHGLSGALGSRITGNATPELKELALGWFVLVYVGCFPIVGWIVALYWASRAIGTALLALFASAEA